MTDKELLAQGKLGLLKLLRDQEAELMQLSEQNQYLTRQLETLLSSLNNKNAVREGDVPPPAECAAQEISPPDRFAPAENAAQMEGEAQPVNEIGGISAPEAAAVLARAGQMEGEEPLPAAEVREADEPEAAVPDGPETQTGEDRPFWERRFEITRLNEENQRLRRQFEELTISAEKMDEAQRAGSAGALPVREERATAAPQAAHLPKVTPRRVPRRA